MSKAGVHAAALMRSMLHLSSRGRNVAIVRAVDELLTPGPERECPPAMARRGGQAGSQTRRSAGGRGQGAAALSAAPATQRPSSAKLRDGSPCAANPSSDSSQRAAWSEHIHLDVERRAATTRAGGRAQRGTQQALPDSPPRCAQRESKSSSQ